VICVSPVYGQLDLMEPSLDLRRCNGDLRGHKLSDQNKLASQPFWAAHDMPSRVARYDYA
jgi:hypothetical protein